MVVRSTQEAVLGSHPTHAGAHNGHNGLCNGEDLESFGHRVCSSNLGSSNMLSPVDGRVHVLQGHLFDIYNTALVT